VVTAAAASENGRRRVCRRAPGPLPAAAVGGDTRPPLVRRR